MRIDQALDFIHACPPGCLSPCLTCCHLNWCRLVGRGGLVTRRRRMPMSGCYGPLSGCPCFVIVPYGPAGQPARYPVTRRPAVPSSQRLHPGAPKLTKPFDRCSSRPPLWHQQCQHPPGPAGLLAVDGVVWRTPDTRTMPAPLPSQNRPGERNPQVRMLCQMELTSHLLTQTVMDSCAVNEMVLAEQLIENTR